MPSFHHCSIIRYLELNPPRRNPANLVISSHSAFVSFRKYFYAIRFYLRAIDNYLAERISSSCVRFSSKREKKIRIHKHVYIKRNWPGYLHQIFTSKSIPSLIVPQSSYCRSIERSREPLSRIRSDNVLSRTRLRFICFEITFNLDFIARSNARGSTWSTGRWWATSSLLWRPMIPPWHNKRGLARSFICLPMPARYRRFRDAELNGDDSNSISYAVRPAGRPFSRFFVHDPCFMSSRSIEIAWGLFLELPRVFLTIKQERGDLVHRLLYVRFRRKA